jgi:hypothetical protein
LPLSSCRRVVVSSCRRVVVCRVSCVVCRVVGRVHRNMELNAAKGAGDHSVVLLKTAISAGHVDTVRAVVSHPSCEQVPDHLLGQAVSSHSELMVGVLLLSGKVRPADAITGLVCCVLCVRCAAAQLRRGGYMWIDTGASDRRSHGSGAEK